MKKVLILGAGPAGLSSAVSLIEQGFEVTVVEKAPMAGGCSSSWKDHRDPDKSVMEYPMHVFASFYENVFDLMHKTGTIQNLVRSDGRWYFIHSDGQIGVLGNRIPGQSWLPAPLHLVPMILDYKPFDLWDKLSTLWGGLRFTFTSEAGLRSYSWHNGLAVYKDLGGFSDGAISIVKMAAYGTTNLGLHELAGDVSAILYNKMGGATRQSIFYHVLNGPANERFIDPIVRYIESKGGRVLYNTEVLEIKALDNRVAGAKVRHMPQSQDALVVCANCGLQASIPFDGLCARCGERVGVAAIGDNGDEIEVLEADYYISALQPWKLRDSLKSDAFRSQGYFRNLWKFDQACLCIAQVWFDRKITNLQNLYIADREDYIFNGVLDRSNSFECYRDRGSVVELLLDDGWVLRPMPEEEMKRRILDDLRKAFPQAREARVEKIMLAKIGPEALYHLIKPGIWKYRPGQRTPLPNFFLAGDWTIRDRLFNLGLEAAVISGRLAANEILVGESKPVAPILEPIQEPLVTAIQETMERIEPVKKQLKWLGLIGLILSGLLLLRRSCRN